MLIEAGVSIQTPYGMEGHAMNENQNTNNNHPNSNHNCKDNLKERRTEDRRRQPSEGFARISIVGWICRRERIRREGDEFKWD
jgi:hypothetical protein